MGVHAKFLRGTFASEPVTDFCRSAEFSGVSSGGRSDCNFTRPRTLWYFVFSTFLESTEQTQLGSFARRCSVRIAVFGLSDPPLSDNSRVLDRETYYPDR